jgi:nucleotide-binding universal stress UspA family protein
MVAVDFSRSSRKVLAQALAVARALDARITVLHVWQAPAMLVSALGLVGRADAVRTAEAHAVEDAEQKLARLLPPALREEAGISTVCEVGEPVGTILAVADELKPDLLVMGTHGRGPLDFLLGSVACQVVARAVCPVLVVPPA